LDVIEEANDLIGNIFNKNIHNILSDLQDALWNNLEILRFIEAYSRDIWRQHQNNNEIMFNNDEELQQLIEEYQDIVDGRIRN